MKVDSQNINDDLEIKITLSKFDQLCLNHDLINIVEWFSQGPSLQKIENCKKRMIKEYRSEFLNSEDIQDMTMQQVNAILENEESLCQKIAALPNYKNRAQREQEISLESMGN